MFDSSLRHQKPNEINKLRSRLVRLFCFLTLRGTAGTPNQFKNSENPRLPLHRQTSHRSPAQIKPKNSSAPCRDLFDDNFQNSDVPRLARSATLAAGSATECAGAISLSSLKCFCLAGSAQHLIHFVEMHLFLENHVADIFFEQDGIALRDLE